MKVTSEIKMATSEDNWTTLSITLHWLIVMLLLVQFLEGEWMVDLFDSGPGATPDDTTIVLGYSHIVAGTLILAASLVRFWDRLAHGRPMHPAGEPNWARGLSKLVHAALYTLLIGMPIIGASAWFTGNEVLGDLHSWAWTALMALAGLHVAGSLVNQFWFRTGVLRRILPGHGRAT